MTSDDSRPPMKFSRCFEFALKPWKYHGNGIDCLHAQDVEPVLDSLKKSYDLKSTMYTEVRAERDQLTDEVAKMAKRLEERELAQTKAERDEWQRPAQTEMWRENLNCEAAESLIEKIFDVVSHYSNPHEAAAEIKTMIESWDKNDET